MINRSKLDESYLLFRKWWEAIELNNYEKGILNKEIISFNQQLLRLKDKHLRIGTWGKAGVGKSTILNKIANEYFFKTGILNGSSKKTRSKDLNFNQDHLRKIEFIDFPGFDICSTNDQKEELSKILDLDLILFIAAGDLNRNELTSIEKLSKIGKKIILILNKTDIWDINETNVILKNIRKKLSALSSITIITNSNKPDINPSQKNRIDNYLKESINKCGEIFLISNTLQIADRLSKRVKECRFLKKKKEAQAIIGKFATIKASGVALNPLLFIDVAGSFILDTSLINQLSKIYGLKIKSHSERKLIRTISINNIFLGTTQISIMATLNLIKKISLIAAPLTGGLTLLPYGPIAIAQAALAIRTTNSIGKLAAKELFKKSNLNNIESFNRIKKIALRGTNSEDTKKIFSQNSKAILDLSIYIP